MDNYDPGKYWTERGKSYYLRNFNTVAYKLQEKLLINALCNLTFTSVLEVGCGFGRITRLILQNFSNIGDYLAFDMSFDQINNAKKYLQHANQVDFIVSDIMSVSGNKKYDLVLAVEVLLHVRPQDLKNTIIKLLSLSRCYLLHVDWQEYKPSDSAPHNFMHDYDSIYQELGLKYQKIAVMEKKSFGRTVDVKQDIYVVQVRT